MLKMFHIVGFLLIIFVTKSQEIELRSLKNYSDHIGSKLLEDEEDDGEGDRSSLVFVFDTTGSMYNDLRQLREGAEMILNTALEDSDVIEDFVFVPYHDPAVGPATVTKDKDVFKAALERVTVYGGGDCPEKSLSGLILALNVSRPRSFIYVFTDATANDHHFVGRVLDLVQRKESQVVFVLTGHCNDLHRPSYKVYPQIAAASSGQVFNLNKTSVHKVLDFVRSSLKGRSVNLGSVVVPAGYNYTQGIPVDNTVGEVTVSVSGAKPSIRVVNPSGEELTGPPTLITTLDLSEIMVVKVLQPEPGNWTITTGSEEDYSVKVVGLSNLTFSHGFSVQPPASPAETTYRPLQSAYNHMLISLTQTDRPVQLNYAEILTLDGKTLFEIPLRVFDGERQIYLADAFVPPDDFFYIAINGHDEFNQELRRIGATAIQAKSPDVPYLTVPKNIEARIHERIILRCNIESLVPITAMWAKDMAKIQPQVSSLQTTFIDYIIEDMSEGDVGSYRCVAKNAAGISKATTEVTLLVDPPQVSISPENKTYEIGESVTLSCVVSTEALLLKYRLEFNGTRNKYVIDINLEPNVEGLYVFNKTMQNLTENDSGVYSCIARNRGGETNQSTLIKVQSQPMAQILGPHSLTKLKYTDIQLVCHVENAQRVKWISPNGTIVRDAEVDGSGNDMLDVKGIQEDGVWRCAAERMSHRVTDSVELNILIKPEVSIDGPKNVTILNGTRYDVICIVTAKPEPRIIWHKETERFLNHSITVIKPNEYKSVLTLDSVIEPVNGTYFCFGENSEGISQDSINVNVRRKMQIIESISGKSVQLYSQASMPCRIDAFPKPKLTWYHNGTQVVVNDNVHISEENTLNILKVDFQNLGMYVCEANNGYEDMKVETTLSVYGLEIPQIYKGSASYITMKGEFVTLPCRVLKGNPDPTLTWEFKKNGSNQFISPSLHSIVADDSDLVLRNITVDNAGVYRCTASNIIGRDMLDTVLIVQYPPKLDDLKEVHDKPMEVKDGDKVKFSCKATGIPPPIVVWTKDNQPVRYSRNVYLTDSSDLVVEKATEYDSGLFTCNATSPAGSVQRNFTLIVYVPPVISSPMIDPELEILEGQLVELPCRAHGSPKPEIMWLQNGKSIKESWKIIDDFGLRFVANLTDFGEYTCIARNKYGNTTRTFSVFIWVPPFIEPPLEIAQSMLIGSNLSLECNAIGFPIPNIFWEFRDQLLTKNATDLSFNNVGNIYIRNASEKHEGPYACIADNIAGFAKKIIHVSVHEPPMILQNNFTGPYVATNRDTALVISCRVTGKPKPYIVWSKDERYLDKDSRYTIDVDGTLTINAPSEELSGLYTCVAKNPVGIAKRTVAVDIYSLPTRMQADESITTLTVLEGTNAEIECPVRASPTDKVKWYKDAKLISTDRLVIANISRHNTSNYACVVSNMVGSTHSIIQLNVEWIPAFVNKEYEENVEAVQGDDVYFDCEADAKPLAKTKWYFNSRPLLGQDESRLKLLNVQLHHTGIYKCIVSNKHGTLMRQYTLDVLVPPFISDFDLLDVQLIEGANATLECNARGSPKPDITWIFNNTYWHLDDVSLSTSNASTHSGGLFRCNAKNKAGATHIVYRVNVVAPAKVNAVVMFKMGDAGGNDVDNFARVEIGTRVRLSCISAGNPTPTVQWIRNGVTLAQNDPNIHYADLILEEVNLTDEGTYNCIVTNEAGMDNKKIKIEVLEPPKIFQNIFQSPSNQTTKLEVLSDQSFSLHCHPYGNPAPSVYWFRDGQPLKLFDDSMVFDDYGEVVAVDRARYDQIGNYTCVARNEIGEASVVYLVDVLVPPTTPKESIKLVSTRIGRSLNLTCPVEGSPLPDVMWIKHPYTEVLGDSRVLLLNDNYTLFINQTEIHDSGKYSCIMTNKVGTTEVVFDVTIEKPPSIAGNDGSNISESRIVPLRRSIVLKCQADGNPPPKTVWLKDTQQISESSSNIHRVLGNSILAIWSVETRDAGQYICVVENNAGTAHRRYNIGVQVPGKWSSWSQWSYCNVTCGLGYQQRSRLCQYIDDYNVTYDKTTNSEKIIVDESSCKGPTVDRRKCHMPSCDDDDQPRWSPWSKWSPCSATCGIGTQTRTRRCRSKVKCGGDNVQIRKCPDLPVCSSNGKTPSENDVFSSIEDTHLDPSAYLPEATYELQPESMGPEYTTDMEEVYVKPVLTSSDYYDVNVTHNLDHSYRGPCDPGYSYINATADCKDIDECLIETNLCHSTQACVNTAGAYRCTCLKGFVALGIGQRCLAFQTKQKPLEETEASYLSTSIDYPARYKYSRN